MLSNSKGFSIVELLMTIGLAAIIFPALLTGFVASRGGRAQQDQRLQAIGLAQETQEEIRVVRESGWDNVPIGNNFYPKASGNTWILAALPEVPARTDGFSRITNVEKVFRDDVTKKIVTTGGTEDPSTKKITTTVSWGNPIPYTVTNIQYLTRNANEGYVETATVQPPAGGFGDWCKPVGPSVTNIDLNRKGHPTSIRAFESGDGTGNRVLAGTGASADGPAFTNIKIIGNSPPARTILGTYEGIPQIKVNGLFGDMHYAFLATDNRGVEILDLTSTPPYQKIGSFNPGGMSKVNDVYVVGNTGYAVTTDKFYIFSISSDRKTTSQIGVLSLTNGAKVVVDSSNQYAYVPNPDTNGELKIIDVHTNPTNLTSADIKNVNVDGGSGRDVFINVASTRAYLATASNAAKPEFFIVNISDKSNPSVLDGGTYDTNGMDPQGVVVVSGARAIIVGTGGHEYQVFSIANDTISFCPNHALNDDFIDVDSGIYSVASVLQSDKHAYSYIATGDKGAELKIIEGGPGNGGIGGNGIFESPTIEFPVNPPHHNVAFNYFSGTSNPNLSYKIDIEQAAGGSCPAIFTNFVPISTGAMVLPGVGYSNPGQCLRYQAINSGEAEITFTVNFNYSP